MEIILNGESFQIASEWTAEKLIEQLGLGEKKLALEVNGEIIPRSIFPQHRMHSGDRVELIHAVGGG